MHLETSWLETEVPVSLTCQCIGHAQLKFCRILNAVIVRKRHLCKLWFYFWFCGL